MSLLTAVLLVGLGLVVGCFGAIIGVGGGFILVPILLLAYPDDDPAIITSISLAVVFFTALSGSLGYARLRRIDYRTGLAFAVATLPGAIVGATATNWLPRQAFDLTFGLLLIAVSIYIATRAGAMGSRRLASLRPSAQRTLTDSAGVTYDYSFNRGLGITISFFVGFIASFLGIGGGIIHVPAMVGLLDFPAHVATATSVFILVFTALAGTAVHIVDGSLAEGWARMIPLAVGVVAGAQIGARLSGRLPAGVIVRLLAVALFVVAIRLIIAGVSG
ncbi:MAG: sulfite exporter TauE/SafE family protein [Dehalococcoidia bacterium]|nr:MAG: sulfite exporter TauE/SafE family protein [Dehalococcoidia bacterium]